MRRKAVRTYRAPRYPAARELFGAPQPVPPTLPERVAGAALRAAAPLAIAAAAAASTPADAPPTARTEISLQDHPQDRADAAPQDSRVRTLTWEEIDALIDEIRVQSPQVADEIMGRVAFRVDMITEAEARLILDAFFEKNGIRLGEGRVGGIDADGWNADLRIGYEYVESEELTDEQRRDLEMMKAEGDAAVLVLDATEFQFQRVGNRPTGKREAVERLHRAVQRHLEWLVANGWVELE